MTRYLTKERNSYTKFVLNKIRREHQNQTLKNHTTQNHHIIPKHWGGPDESWNIITLSIEDHAYAHKLLYENSDNYYDLCAASMLQGQTQEALDALRKANQEKMKKLGESSQVFTILKYRGS